jgi:hypothetical protein
VSLSSAQLGLTQQLQLEFYNEVGRKKIATGARVCSAQAVGVIVSQLCIALAE